MLRRLENSSKSEWDYIWDSPYYVPMTRNKLREFEVYIMGEKDEEVTIGETSVVNTTFKALSVFCPQLWVNYFER